MHLKHVKTRSMLASENWKCYNCWQPLFKKIQSQAESTRFRFNWKAGKLLLRTTKEFCCRRTLSLFAVLLNLQRFPFLSTNYFFNKFSLPYAMFIHPSTTGFACFGCMVFKLGSAHLFWHVLQTSTWFTLIHHQGINQGGLHHKCNFFPFFTAMINSW